MDQTGVRGTVYLLYQVPSVSPQPLPLITTRHFVYVGTVCQALRVASVSARASPCIVFKRSHCSRGAFSALCCLGLEAFCSALWAWGVVGIVDVTDVTDLPRICCA